MTYTAVQTNAPIALFAYARLDHLTRTVESLKRNAECVATRLHVFCDGPRGESDRTRTEEVRAYVAQITGFESVEVTLRAENFGLARSIVAGVTDVLRKYGSVIVVEDDLLVAPHFLKYMNDGLRVYAGNERVASIHGYCYPVREQLPETFFLRGADCWGWATWRRAWQHFEPDGNKLLDELKRQNLTHQFDFNGAYPYVTMLKNQIAGKNDSWAIRWHAACFIANMLTLYPGKSLVDNIGNDDSGTHCSSTDHFQQQVATSPIRVEAIEVRENEMARRSFANFLGGYTSLSAKAGRLLRRMQEWVRRA